MKKIIALFFILSISSYALIFSETPEERLLNKKIRTYTYQAKVGNREIKMAVLDNITNEYASENYSNSNKELLDLVVYLSEEGTLRQEFENNRLMNDFPEVRTKACFLLGKLGGEAARNALINVLANDTTQSVKAEACTALGKIGDNERGEVLKAIVYSYRSTYQPDGYFVYAIIHAVKELAKGKTAAYGDAILVLSEIQMGQYPSYIREEAFKVIKELSKE